MAVSIGNMRATFANSSYRYDAISMNVNAIAYTANSTLINLKVKGNTKFYVDVGGNTNISGNTVIGGNLLIYGSLVVTNSISTINVTSINVTTVNATTINVITGYADTLNVNNLITYSANVNRLIANTANIANANIVSLVANTINAGQILVNGIPVGFGAGDFNTNIANSASAELTTDLVDLYTAPSTTGKQYIIRSIHVTNISDTEAFVSGELQGTNYSNTTFASNVPVPVQSAVELLRKPKIMYANDILRLKADLVSSLHATLAYETQDSTSYFGAGVDINNSVTYYDLWTATKNSVIESILLSNDSGLYDAKARVVWTDGSNNIQGYFCYDMIIPADSTVELLEAPKNLPGGYKIRIYSNFITTW